MVVKRQGREIVQAESGEDCRAEPGYLRPVVDHARCEAKHCCEKICPFNVFEVRRIEKEDFRALPFGAKIKVFAHGMKTAYTPNADACRACTLCVDICPESAIQLIRHRE
jgi:NAD-dependent dihydropyrimidine dehydrogenase PreA subunit